MKICHEFEFYIDEFANISVNWIFVESFAIAFKPLAECTKHMQKEQYVLGDFFRDWLKCEFDLVEMLHTNANAKALYNAMGIRKCKLLENNAFVAALYLDPRFNFHGTPLLTPEQQKNAMVHLNLNFLILIFFLICIYLFLGSFIEDIRCH